MFTTFTNYIWGGDSAEEAAPAPSVPRAQEVEDWIVVGEKPTDFHEKRESKTQRSSPPRAQNSKHRLHSAMFGDGSSGKSSSGWSRAASTSSGKQHQSHKQNFSIKMAGNRNLKQC